VPPFEVVQVRQMMDKNDALAVLNRMVDDACPNRTDGLRYLTCTCDGHCAIRTAFPHVSLPLKAKR
jgi:hypothetical protein